MSQDLTLRHLIAERPLAVLDLESTGLDVRQDRIIEVAVLKLQPETESSFFYTRLDPQCPVSAEATRVHRLTDADLQGQPTFRAIAQPLRQFLQDCDLIGFGLVTFDLPLLLAEFARINCHFDLCGRSIVDVLALYRRMEPRDLASAVKYYLHRNHTSAHEARADARATLEVLDAQIGQYDLPRTAAGLHAELIEVDVGCRFRRDDAGQIVFNFGKFQGRPLAAVAASDPSYLEWMLRQPFLEDAQDLVRRALADTSFFDSENG
jgi:DNA polymerase III subunit epsilon